MTKRSRFVQPDLRVLPISNGDTLTVRKRLNHGEQTAVFARMYATGLDGALRVDPLKSGQALVVAYLIDWTLTNDAGDVVKIRDLPPDGVEAALNALEPEAFTEIKEAIEKHELEMIAERATTDGTPAAAV